MSTQGGPAPGRQQGSDAAWREKAQELGGRALDILTELMTSDAPPAVRLAAAREVLERALGRPKPGGATEADPKGLTVIVKRYSEITEEEEARADEGEP